MLNIFEVARDQVWYKQPLFYIITYKKKFYKIIYRF